MENNTTNDTPKTGEEINSESVVTNDPNVEQFGNYNLYTSIGNTFTPPVKEEVKTEEPTKEESSLNTEKPTTPPATEVKADVPQTETKTETQEEKTLSPVELLKKLDAEVEEKYGFSSYREAEEYVNTDFSNHGEDGVSEEDTIIQWMINQDPGITNEEINAAMAEFEPLFLTDEQLKAMEDAGEKLPTKPELLQLEAKFAKMLRTAESGLKEDQAKIDLKGLGVVQKQETQTQTNQQNTKQELSPEVLQEIGKFVSESVSGVKDTFKILDLKDGKELAAIEYTGTPEDAKKTTDAVAKAFDRWINPDKSVNWDVLVKELHYLENRERIHSTIYNQARSIGAEAQIRDVNNLDFEKHTSIPSSEGKKSIAEQYGMV